jgi:hypothetical protein
LNSVVYTTCISLIDGHGAGTRAWARLSTTGWYLLRRIFSVYAEGFQSGLVAPFSLRCGITTILAGAGICDGSRRDVRENGHFWAICIKNASFCQDRLGTNIGKTQKRGRFLRCVFLAMDQQGVFEVRKRSFQSHLCVNAFALPRQARDEHRT